MKSLLRILLVFAVLMIPSLTLAANDTVEKTDCKLASGYDSMDDLKADLLLSAKRLAVNELFGELITAVTAVEDFVVTSDQIRASSLGLVRENSIKYFNSDNFGELCVTITVYTTEADRKQFEPIKRSKRNCVSDSDMSAKELRKFAEEEAIVKAVLEYNRKLDGQARNKLLNLLQQVNYTESAMLPGTDTYCVSVEGYITPIEAMALLEGKTEDNPVSATPEKLPESEDANWEVIFYDDFEDGDDRGWIRDRPMNWSVEDGQYVLTIHNSNQRAQASVGLRLTTDYAIEFKIKNTKCVDNGLNILGLYDFDFRHGHEYGAPNIVLTGGSQIENQAYPLERNVWYKVKIEVSKQNVFVYVDDNLIVSHLDTQPPSPSDAIGLFGWTGACDSIKSYFDDVTVYVNRSLQGSTK